MVPNTANQSAQALLKRFVQFGDQRAFAEIVRTHADLVYSAALRLLGEHRHAADDVAQTVFADLSAKARSLPEDIALAGWLHQHTCFVAKKALRSELRRLRREDTAHAMTPSDDATDALWLQVRPLLDDALGELPEADRHALVLRFLQGRPFKSVADTLATSEDAARMRVGRALDRLREVLAKRGVLTTSDALNRALANYAVVVAPAALIAVIAASTATAAVSAALPILTAMKAAKVAAAALVVAGGVLLVREHQENARLRDELAQFRSLQAEIDKLQEEKDRLAARVPSIDEVNAARRSLDELQKLRSQVSSLQKTVTVSAEKAAPSSGVEKEPNWSDLAMTTVHQFNASVNGSIQAGDTMVLGGWETARGKTTVAMFTPRVTDDGASIDLESRYIEAPTEVLKEMSLDWARSGTNQVGSLAELGSETAKTILERFTEKGVDALSCPKALIGNGQEARIAVEEMRTIAPQLHVKSGPGFHLIPTIRADGKIGLAIKAGINVDKPLTP